MVTLTRNDDTFHWEDKEVATFERIRNHGGVSMPVSSNAVNAAIHRAAGRSNTPRKLAATFNGAHRRRVRTVK